MMGRDMFLQQGGRIICGLDGSELAAAALWWRGIGQDVLGRIPARQGIGWARAALRSGAGLAAVDGAGRLVGILGLRNAAGGLLDWTVPMRPWFGVARSVVARASIKLWRGGPATTYMVVDGLVVHPCARRQGIAGLLLEAALQRACNAGHGGLQVEIAADNKASLQLHRHAAFDEVGGYRAGHNRKVIVMRKPC